MHRSIVHGEEWHVLPPLAVPNLPTAENRHGQAEQAWCASRHSELACASLSQPKHALRLSNHGCHAADPSGMAGRAARRAPNGGVPRGEERWRVGRRTRHQHLTGSRPAIWRSPCRPRASPGGREAGPGACRLPTLLPPEAGLCPGGRLRRDFCGRRRPHAPFFVFSAEHCV